MTIKQKFSSIDQSKLTADQKAFLTKIKDVTKNFTDKEMNKKVEAPLNGFIEKAKEKMPEAIKSAPVRRTTKSKAKPTRTSSSKPTAMTLAKEIRKEEESWSSARARASKMMKEKTKTTSKDVESELDKLIKLVRGKKDRAKLSGISGTNIKRDSTRKAKPRGRRISKDGNVYYENRENRTDRLAPNYPKYAPYLEDGGYLTDTTFGNFQAGVYAGGGGIGKNTDVILSSNSKDKLTWRGIVTPNVLKDIEEFQYQGGHKRYEIDIYDENLLEKPNKENINKLNGFLNKIGIMFGTVFVYAEDYATGGSVTNERRYVNKDEDYEVRYSRPILRRKGYQGKRDFELGGVMATDLAGHTGGKFGTGDPSMLSGNSGTAYTGLVGETGAMSSGEMFMAGGRITTNKEILEAFLDSKKELKVGNLTTHYSTLGDVVLLRNYGTLIAKRKGNKVSINNKKYSNTTTTITNLLEKLANNQGMKVEKISEDSFEHGGGLPHGAEQSYMITEALGNPAQHFNTGGSITNERKHVNHDEDYEVRYAKPRPSRKGYKGARKFMAGGSMETPRIYVADLEAYNNGRLEGEWLDLADYNDADELMDAIQDVLKKSGGEEYAIHDVEYIPSSMYSEYMGKRDFEELYKMMDLAKQNDLPLEVVQEVVSQYDASAVDDFVGKYDTAVDFAEQLVDDMGIESFNDFEYYLDISETDRRLLSQEMADSYTDDIRDEDGGNRLIEEAGLDVEEYEEAESDRQEEMLDEAREIVYDEYYNNWMEGLSDPYYFLVEEQGMYDAESFANASFVRIDFEKLADALEQDYTYIYDNASLYVFNIR